MSDNLNIKKRKNSFEFLTNLLKLESEEKETKDNPSQSIRFSYKMLFISHKIIQNIDLNAYDFIFAGRKIYNTCLTGFASFQTLLTNIKNTFNPYLLLNNINIDNIIQNGKFSFNKNNLTELHLYNSNDNNDSKKKNNKFMKDVEISINNRYIKTKNCRVKHFNFYGTKSFFKGKHCFEVEILKTNKKYILIGIINISYIDKLKHNNDDENSYKIFSEINEKNMHVYKVENQFFLKKNNNIAYIHYLTYNDIFGFCYDLDKNLFYLFINGILIDKSILKINLGENNSFVPYINIKGSNEIIINPGDELKYGTNYSEYGFVSLDEYGKNNYELSNLKKITDDYLDILLNVGKLIINNNNITYSDINQLFHIIFDFLGNYSFKETYIIYKSIIKKLFLEKYKNKLIKSDELEMFYLCFKYILNSSSNRKIIIKNILLNIEETILIFLKRGNSEYSLIIHNLIQLLLFLLFKKDLQIFLQKSQKITNTIFEDIFILFNTYHQYFGNNYLDIITETNYNHDKNKDENPNLYLTIENAKNIYFQGLLFKSQLITKKLNQPNYLDTLIEGIYHNGTDDQSKFIYKRFKHFIYKEILIGCVSKKRFCEIFKTIYIPLMRQFNNEYSKNDKMEISVKKYLKNNNKLGERLGGLFKDVYEKYGKNIENSLNLKVKDFKNVFLLEIFDFIYKRELNYNFWSTLCEINSKIEMYYKSILLNNEKLNNLETIHEKIMKFLKYKSYYFNRDDYSIIIQFLYYISDFIINELYTKKLVYFFPKSFFNKIKEILKVIKGISKICTIFETFLSKKNTENITIKKTIGELLYFFVDLKNLCSQCNHQYFTIYIKIINDENIQDVNFKEDYLSELIDSLFYDEYFTDDEYDSIFNYINKVYNKPVYDSFFNSFISIFDNNNSISYNNLGKRLNNILNKNTNFLKKVIILLYEDIDKKLTKLEEAFSEYHFIPRDSQNNNLINKNNFHQNIIYSKNNSVIVINDQNNNDELMNQNHIENLSNALIPLGERRLIIISDLQNHEFNDKEKLNSLIFAINKFNSEFIKLINFYSLATKVKGLYQNNTFEFKKLLNLLLSLNNLLFSKNNISKIEFNINQKNDDDEFNNIKISYSKLLKNICKFYNILSNNIIEINDKKILIEISKKRNVIDFKENLKIIEKFNPAKDENDYKNIKDFIMKLENLIPEEEIKKENEAKIGNNTDENNNACLICSDAIIDCHISPCGHPICTNCLEQYLFESKKCPFCRTEIKGIMEDPNFKI